jgi:hypothetical protein
MVYAPVMIEYFREFPNIPGRMKTGSKLFEPNREKIGGRDLRGLVVARARSHLIVQTT